MWMLLLANLLNQAVAQTPIKARTSFDPDRPLYSATLELKTPNVPREDLGEAIIKDKSVRECLRESLQSAGDDFQVHISGHVDAHGQLSEANVDSYRPAPLAQCVQDAVNAMKLKKHGPDGDFQITIQRLRVTGRDAKTYTLDLNEP